MDFSEHTLLIVDDEKNTREGLRLSLEDEFDVYIAANIAEAEEILKSESIEVMLTAHEVKLQEAVQPTAFTLDARWVEGR